MSNIYVGIDIGKAGAIVWRDVNKSVFTTLAMPMIGKELDIPQIDNILSKFSPHHTHVVFEKLGVIFGSSKTTARSMGLQEGIIEALCVAHKLPYTKVPPKTWQKTMFEGLSEMKRGDGKRDTKAMALVIAKRLFPSVNLLATPRSTVPHDGIVDALLLSEFGRRYY